MKGENLSPRTARLDIHLLAQSTVGIHFARNEDRVEVILKEMKNLVTLDS